MKPLISDSDAAWFAYPRDPRVSRNSIIYESHYTANHVYFLLYKFDQNLVSEKLKQFFRENFTCAYCGKQIDAFGKKCKCVFSKKNLSGYPLFEMSKKDYEILCGFKTGLLAYEKRRDRTRWRRKRENDAEGNYTKSDLINIWNKQKCRCFYCEGSLGENFKDRKYHVDHRVSLHDGGSNWPKNIVLSCKFCNLSKSNRDPVEFKKYIKNRIKRMLKRSKKDWVVKIKRAGFLGLFPIKNDLSFLVHLSEIFPEKNIKKEFIDELYKLHLERSDYTKCMLKIRLANEAIKKNLLKENKK